MTVTPTQTSAKSPTWDRLRTLPLSTLDGRELRVAFAVDPVIDLRASALGGHRIEARVLDAVTGVELSGRQRRQLLARDWGRIDLACLERAISRLASSPPSEKPALIVQLSFVSLSNNAVRRLLLERAAKVSEEMRRAVIWELVDFESGVPSGSLIDIMRLVRPVCRGVFYQIEPTSIALQAVRSAKAAGITVRASDLGRSKDSMIEGLRRFAAAAGSGSGAQTITVTSLPDEALLYDALAAGFSHASLRAVEAQALPQRQAQDPSAGEEAA